VGLAEMDRGHYSEMENGKRNISVETLKRIADALHPPAWKLLKDADS
jgi:transcriptional regulator with XRE-family HTH domain